MAKPDKKQGNKKPGRTPPRAAKPTTTKKAARPAKPAVKPAAKPAAKPVAKAPVKPASKAPGKAPVEKAAAKPAAPVVMPKIVNSGPKEVIPAVAPKQVWRASNELPPPKKKPGKGAPPPSIRDPRKEALEAMRAQQAAAERAAAKNVKKIDFSNIRSVASVAATLAPDKNGYVLVNGRRVRVIPTKGLKIKKKHTKTVAAERVEGPTDAQIAAIKTKLTAKELGEYRQILLQQRKELIARVTGLEDEALRSSGGNLSTMPLHMADIGTDTFDQDLAIGMAESERALLREIDDALTRIHNKTYGVCQLTGKPIPKTRLEAKPWAKYTIEAARQIEKSGAR
ncbi:MAG: TraR/DksA C4-type zinc finger protein [Phycisphaerales bacterium]